MEPPILYRKETPLGFKGIRVLLHQRQTFADASQRLAAPPSTLDPVRQ
jgi:hypothetical protein